MIHPSLGKVKIPGYFGHFRGCTAGTVRAAHDLGENIQEILKTIGGYNKDGIHQFEKEGIIWQRLRGSRPKARLAKIAVYVHIVITLSASCIEVIISNILVVSPTCF